MKNIAAPFAGKSDCWEWPLSRNVKSGYGQLSAYIDGKHRLFTAHALSYRVFVGDTAGLFVCHHCDNRGCFNPDHLFIGSAMDNALDAILKGRKRGGNAQRGDQHWARRKPELIRRGDDHPSKRRNPYAPRGSDNKNAKLTEAAVMDIRSFKGPSIRLAEKYKVSNSTICHIRNGKGWAHVPSPIQQPGNVSHVRCVVDGQEDA